MLRCDRILCPLYGHKIVANRGSTGARYVFVGEAPGREEVKEGEAFVGMSGIELNSSIRMAGIPAQLCYFMNVICCNPPKNRDPKREEIDYCSYRFFTTLSSLNPVVLVAVGRISASILMGTDVNMERVRGFVYPSIVQGVPVMPIYHPAAAMKGFSIRMKYIRDDLARLQKMFPSIVSDTFVKQDEFFGAPGVDYKIIDNEIEAIQYLRGIVERQSPIGLDTESVDGVPYSVQISDTLGKARMFLFKSDWFFPVFEMFFKAHQGPIAIHNADYDVKDVLEKFGLDVGLHRVEDTMIMAASHPESPVGSGLKKLAYRFLKTEMASYSTVMSAFYGDSLQQYLLRAREVEWPRELTKSGKPSKKKNTTDVLEQLFGLSIPPSEMWKKLPSSRKAELRDKLGEPTFPNISTIPTRAAVNYACTDADMTLRLWDFLNSWSPSIGMTFALIIDNKLLDIVIQMERNGFKIDSSVLGKIEEEIRTKSKEIWKVFEERAGSPLNLNSPSQMLNFLKGIGELPVVAHSTDAKYLNEKLTENTPGIRGLLEYRQLEKLRSTYATPLTEKLDSHGRVHTKLTIGGTRTGRLASSEPNLMNIPVRTNIGRLIRSAFVAENNYVLIGSDYSQIELRVLAHLSKDPNMIDAFRSGKDIHKSTAARIFGIREEDVKSDIHRGPAKTVAFGVIYGMSVDGLATRLGWQIYEAEKFMNEFFVLYPGIKIFMKEKVAETQKKGYVTNMFGRIRYIPEVRSPLRYVREAGERMCINTPIQGTAADIMKLAMISLGGLSRRFKGVVYPLLQVHDELIHEVRSDYTNTIIAEVERVMKTAVTLSVPLEVNSHTGNSYMDLK